jgi:hypothetical protein
MVESVPGYSGGPVLESHEVPFSAFKLPKVRGKHLKQAPTLPIEERESNSFLPAVTADHHASGPSAGPTANATITVFFLPHGV